MDKNYRLLHGLAWWPDEQPSDEIKRQVEEKLEGMDWEVDVVLTHGQPEKSLISCGFARFDLFTSTCFCLSWCVTASVFSGVNGFWLRSILNPPQRKLIEQKTE